MLAIAASICRRSSANIRARDGRRNGIVAASGTATNAPRNARRVVMGGQADGWALADDAAGWSIPVDQKNS